MACLQFETGRKSLEPAIHSVLFTGNSPQNRSWVDLDVHSNHPAIPPKNPAILSLAISQTINWAGLFHVFPTLLIFWEAHLGWSRAEITGALTLAIVMSGLGSPICGKLMDLGQGPLMMTSCILRGPPGLLGLSVVNDIFGFYFLWAVVVISFSGCLYEPLPCSCYRKSRP